MYTFRGLLDFDYTALQPIYIFAELQLHFKITVLKASSINEKKNPYCTS